VIPALFFDLDGVLADFVRGAFDLHERAIPMRDVRWDFCSQIGFNGPADPAFWKPMGWHFWAHLEPLVRDGFPLLRAAERMLPADRIALLTSAAGEPGCIDGKRTWVERHLPGYLPRLFTGSAKHLFAAHGKILIDDNEDNAHRFAHAGGLTVLLPRPWNSRRDECNEAGDFNPCDLAEEVRDALRVASRTWHDYPQAVS
jgi:hypothetical protein